MKVAYQFAVVCIFLLIGECLAFFIPLPLPGSVIGMALLLIVLLLGKMKVERIESFADILLQNMTIIFLPICAVLVDYLDVLKEFILPILAIAIITTITTYYVTAYTTKLTIYIISKVGKK